jgi:hypothetical protein
MGHLHGFKYNTGIQKSLSLKYLNPKGGICTFDTGSRTRI